MNRWHIYEILKNNEIPNQSTIKDIEKMEAKEVKEGLLEWFILLSKNGNRLGFFTKTGSGQKQEVNK